MLLSLSCTHSLTHSLSHSFTHSDTQLRTHSITHSLTDSRVMSPGERDIVSSIRFANEMDYQHIPSRPAPTTPTICNAARMTAVSLIPLKFQRSLLAWETCQYNNTFELPKHKTLNKISTYILKKIKKLF